MITKFQFVNIKHASLPASSNFNNNSSLTQIYSAHLITTCNSIENSIQIKEVGQWMYNYANHIALDDWFNYDMRKNKTARKRNNNKAIPIPIPIPWPSNSTDYKILTCSTTLLFQLLHICISQNRN